MKAHTEMVSKWAKAVLRALRAPGRLFFFAIRLSRVLGDALDQLFYDLRRKGKPGEPNNLAKLIFGGAVEAGKRLEELLHLNMEDQLN